MPGEQVSQETLKPLKITCTSTDCANGLHCFRRTRTMVALNQQGRCRACGAELIDWRRVHKRNPADAAYTFAALKYELFRHHFWHVEIDLRAVNHARRKGKRGLQAAAEQRMRKAVGPAEPPFDGRQTPREGSGNVIYYAQHATASCCRKCIAEWHGIPRGRELTEDEIAYLTTLAMLYIDERLPLLTQDGEKVPRLTRRSHEVSSDSSEESTHVGVD
jgi:hypothetical protein